MFKQRNFRKKAEEAEEAEDEAAIPLAAPKEKKRAAGRSDWIAVEPMRV
jgi:hypothetical protein